MQSDELSIELVFKPEWGSEAGLGIVRLSPADVQNILEHPDDAATPVPDGVVSLQERRFYTGSWQRPSDGPREPRITVPGSTAMEGQLVEVEVMFQKISGGAVAWGGYFKEFPDDHVHTPFTPIEALRAAVEPYPIDAARAEEWREVAKSDPARAAVLLRRGHMDQLALHPEDLLVLFEADDRNVREVAQAVIGRVIRGRATHR